MKSGKIKALNGASLFLIYVLVLGTNCVHPTVVEDGSNSCENEYDSLCMDCNTVGICRIVNGSFVVVTSEVCTDDDKVCSSAFGETGCYRLAPSLSPVCLCDNGQGCSIDPFDPSSHVICGNDSITYGSCGTSGNFNLTSCSCVSECLECGASYPGPNPDDCSSYYSCGSGEWVEQTCPDDRCFNPDLCSCDVDCPPCGFAPYPGDPTKFVYCENGENLVSECFEGGEFYPDTCECLRPPSGGSTTNLPPITAFPTTTSGPVIESSSSSSPGVETTVSPGVETTVSPGVETTVSPGVETTVTGGDPCAYCGFYEHPGLDCNTYYECNGDGTTVVRQCPEQLCFNPTTCNCDIISGGIVTTASPVYTTVAGQDPCEKCGFYHEPDQNCSMFYECEPDGSVTESTCPGDLCFNPETCHCELF